MAFGENKKNAKSSFFTYLGYALLLLMLAVSTVLLWPAEVEMIVFASQKGRLSLSLRNYEDSSLDRDLEKRSVNFKMLEKEIPKYNKQREERRRLN